MYHASGRPTLHTGSIVNVPVNVKASLEYGHGISATGYARLDRNGVNARILRDASVSAKGTAKRHRKAEASPVLTSVTLTREDKREAYRIRLQAERRIAGTIGNVE